MERRLLLNIVVSERAAVLKLLAREDEALLIRRNALLVLDLLLHILDRVAGLHVERDGLARERLHENLHGLFLCCSICAREGACVDEGERVHTITARIK